MHDPQLARVLIRAAEIVEANGLHKHTYFQGQSTDDLEGMIHPLTMALSLVAQDEAPACCTLGAIYYAVAQEKGLTEGSRVALRASAAVAEVIGATDEKVRAGAVDDVPEWNDRAERTAEDVVAALRRAAERYTREIIA